MVVNKHGKAHSLSPKIFLLNNMHKFAWFEVLVASMALSMMAKENACVLEPWAANEMLDPQHGEVNAKFSYNNPICWKHNFQSNGGVLLLIVY